LPKPGATSSSRGSILLSHAPCGAASLRDPLLRGLAMSSTADPQPAVLVVDDQQYIRDMLGGVLRAQGIAALLAAGGAEAVALLQERGGEIGAAVVDLTLPGMDGYATVAALRAVKADLPCLLMAAGEVSEERFCASGAFGVLAKPFTPEDLYRAVLHLPGLTRQQAPDN
jgi:CheY-like chemotaxis protein